VPSIAGTRPAAEHHMFANNANHRDDWLDSFYLQSTSQIDGLRHMRHPRYGFYGGVKDEATEVGRPELGIQLVAERGIAGRGLRSRKLLRLSAELVTCDGIHVADAVVVDGVCIIECGSREPVLSARSGGAFPPQSVPMTA